MNLHIPQRRTGSSVSCAHMVSVWGRSPCWHVDHCWAQQPSPSSAQFAPYAYGCSHHAMEETRGHMGNWEFLYGGWWGRKVARYKLTFIWIFFCSSSMASCWAALRAARRSSRSLQTRHRKVKCETTVVEIQVSHSSKWQLESNEERCSHLYMYVHTEGIWVYCTYRALSRAASSLAFSFSCLCCSIRASCSFLRISSSSTRACRSASRTRLRSYRGSRTDWRCT